jgi:hypothetical protein
MEEEQEEEERCLTPVRRVYENPLDRWTNTCSPHVTLYGEDMFLQMYSILARDKKVAPDVAVPFCLSKTYSPRPQKFTDFPLTA